MIEDIHEAADALVPPIAIGGHWLQRSASIGVAIYPDHGEGIERLMISADHAMYRHKRARPKSDR